MTLPSYLSRINQLTPTDFFSKFRKRFIQISSCRAIDNTSSVSKGRMREIPLVSAQTTFGRLRYRRSAKTAANWPLLWREWRSSSRLPHSLWALRRPAAAYAVNQFPCLKCCNPIGQFRNLPAASVGFVFSPKKVDVDLLLDRMIIRGKFHRIRSNGVRMHSEQTDKHSSLYI